MPLTNDNLPLGYTKQWLNLGIINHSQIQRDVELFENGNDPNPEHYRYSAFSSYLTTQSEIDPDLAKSLFQLGADDTDYSMGGSIMADILHHKSCPESLLNESLSSDRPHLRRIAQRRKSVNQ